MKDYTFTKEERNLFIKEFKCSDDKLFLNMADKTTYTVPNDPITKENVIEKMREQVLTAKSYIINLNIFLSGGLLSLSVGQTILIHLQNELDSKNIIAYGLLGLTSIISTIHLKKELAIRHDLNKHLLYLDIEEEIDEVINQNDNIMAGLSNKAQKIMTVDAETYGINLSLIEKIPMKDLIQLENNYDRCYHFEKVLKK